MLYEIPRVVIAGTGSGCGKTTVTCAILQALVNRRFNVGSFKCGPDYIDPMFHSEIIGAKSSNLDCFFFDENTLRYLLIKNGCEHDISIIEGVMGFYDGISMTDAASSYKLSLATESPAVLVVDAKGAALSVLAVIEGFSRFCADAPISGVILNHCTEMTYSLLKAEIEKRFPGRIRPLGFLPSLPECSLKSRHLGLVTAAEVKNLREKLQILAENAEKSLDLDAIIDLAKSAPKIAAAKVEPIRFDEPVRIAVARDKAFCFYYEDSLDILREMGAELVDFSPLNDTALPEDIHGLYLGGGYPELYAEKLSQNSRMRHNIKSALENRLPCIAECGGFIYLTEYTGEFPMVGFLAGKSYDNGRLTRFGYVKLRADFDNMLCRAGESIAAHEFHRWESEYTGCSFTAEKPSGRSWSCVFANEVLYAGYPHFHFYSNLKFAENFYKACLKEKHRHV